VKKCLKNIRYQISDIGYLILFSLVGLVGLSCGNDTKNRDGKTTLVLYHWMERDRDFWTEKVIVPFEREHPNITVRLESAPYGLYVSKVMTSIASGAAVADLLFAEDWFGQELIQRSYARNLMPYAKRDLNLDDFFDDAFQEWRGVAQKPDELYGFPASVGLTVLFYNKEMFDEAGIPYPDTTWTYDDLVRVAKQLTVDRDSDGVPDQRGLELDIQYTGLETVVYSLGGRFLSPDLSRAILTEPATINAFNFIQDIYHKHQIASFTTSIISPWEPFLARKAAMNLIGSHGSMDLVGTGMQWDLTMPPKGKDGLRLSRRFSMAFMIPQTSKHPDEAWELLKWILTRSPAESVDRQYLGMMPTYRPVVRSRAWLDAEPRYNRQVIVDLAEHHSLPLYTPGWQEWRDNDMTPNLTSFLTGGMTVDEFTRDTEERINAVLERCLAESRESP
jgi:multiple sugar transport system substrate-binding protein